MGDKKIFSRIIGTGSYIPTVVVKNKDFKNSRFVDIDGKPYVDSNSKKLLTNPEIIEKFLKITGIEERRYVEDNLVASDIAAFSAADAIQTSGIDKESLGYIIVAHNFGDVLKNNRRSDLVPTLASRVKEKLGIQNVKTVAYDVPFGCPGWLEGLIHADSFIRLGKAKRAMVIGVDTLSRISDPHDRDSLIYSDGAGATIVEESKLPGFLSDITETHTENYNGKSLAHLLTMGESYHPSHFSNELFLKMDGSTLFQFALENVPRVVHEAIAKSRLSLEDISKVFIHQANEKLDEKILSRIFNVSQGEFKKQKIAERYMPMTINKLGNNSVATIPILFDLYSKNNQDYFKVKQEMPKKGDFYVFASVGAGMNINVAVYKN